MLYSSEVSPRMFNVRKQKLCKDEATFTKGKPQEEVRYWPCEHQGRHIAAEHQRFKLYPIGHITEYCKHVPYRSEKKPVFTKTGREVFQYTFQMPVEEKRHTVMWDYNNGLVRITPFFKALEYPKTTPARMLGKNPGLKEICHSITGGSLAAQGYWMPFEAARAVAATFCYRIRYVLTPIFGLDFPAQCIPPGAPGYDSMHIAPEIIRNCNEPVMGGYNTPREPKLRSRPEAPSSAGTSSWTAANGRPKSLKAFGSESGYSTETDTEHSDTYFCSPKKRGRSGFRSLMTPRSSGSKRRYKTCYAPSSTPSTLYGDDSELSDNCKRQKRNIPRCTGNDLEGPDAVMTTEDAARQLLAMFMEDTQRSTAEMPQEKVKPAAAAVVVASAPPDEGEKRRRRASA
ncbi:MAG: hypothetical protein Q9177_001553 [Variospora cf. flavescens]